MGGTHEFVPGAQGLPGGKPPRAGFLPSFPARGGALRRPGGESE